MFVSYNHMNYCILFHYNKKIPLYILKICLNKMQLYLYPFIIDENWGKTVVNTINSEDKQ